MTIIFALCHFPYNYKYVWPYYVVIHVKMKAYINYGHF